LQLGGCDPVELAQAARIGAAAGYAEINLNVGCPSDRVKSGAFGACLMLQPDLVAECVRRIRDAVQVPVTVKCRIGIDDRDDYEFFSKFVDAVACAPVDVHRLKRERPSLAIVINGGLGDCESVRAQLNGGLDGVMLGRAVYHRPALLSELETAVINPAWRTPQPREVLELLVPYARRQAARGLRLHAVTRHMHGLMAGREGARAWRRFLSEISCRPEMPPEALYTALPLLNLGLAA
jgi:tRNA-dihydrouridine synthase A